ncbi:hypothetical protein [Spiroplasma endosymbiont of Labia minor]|uniref:hypothetical protein n=1 Tax=Spiroplasma endosymbiont of Labia minor TaxID=3066305 RepID=UPI0030CC07AD
MGIADSSIGRLLGLLTPEEKEYNKKIDEAQKKINKAKKMFSNERNDYDALVKYDQWLSSFDPEIISEHLKNEMSNDKFVADSIMNSAMSRMKNLRNRQLNIKSDEINLNNDNENQLNLEIQIKEKELELLKLKAQLNRNIEK